MYRHQSGFISLTWLSYFFTLAVIVLCGVKLVPVYTEHVYVEDAMRHLVENNNDLSKLDRAELKSQIVKYMTMNTVGAEQSKSFIIERQRDGYLISSIYEVRVPFFLNIDAVLSFKSQLDTANPDACCDYVKDVAKKTSK